MFLILFAFVTLVQEISYVYTEGFMLMFISAIAGTGTAAAVDIEGWSFRPA